MIVGVAPSESQSGLRVVNADSDAVRTRFQQSHDQASGPGTDIENPELCFYARKVVRRRFDERLGFRPWDKHAGTNIEFKTPEFLPAGDVGERLAGGTPRNRF